jgi:Peptidase family M1 domain/Peptidase M1 N-terminal domain
VDVKRLVLIAILIGALVPASAAASAHRSRPDLKVTGVTNPPASAKAGDPLEVSGEIANRGTRSAKGTVSVSLREREDGPTAAELLQTVRLRVKAHHKTGFSGSAQVPSGLAGGNFLVVACVHRRGHSGPERCSSSASPIAIVAPQGPPSDNPPPANPPPDGPPSPYTPGARTLGDPLLPQLGNGGYDALHYRLELDYDPAANELDTATTTITAVATQDLSELSLDFQDLPVDGVSVDGTPASFSQVGSRPLGDAGRATQPMKLVVDPVTGIPDGTQFTVEVDYHGQPQVITDPDGSIEGWIPACYTVASVQTCDSSFVVGEPLGSQAWFPSNNYPSDKATFETEITVPTGRQAFGSGELTQPPTDNGDGTTTWSWSEDDPTATYLVTATNGSFQYSQTTAAEALTARTLPIYNALDPSATVQQQANFASLVNRDTEMINFLGARYGPYPFDSYGAIYDRTTGINYALEVQTKSHFSALPSTSASGPSVGAYSTYLHELSHMWFGDAVSPRQWDDVWFNEGWASFSENEFNFATGATSTSPHQAFLNLYNNPGFDWSLAPAVLGGDPANLFDGSATYARPGAMIQGYREILGDDTLFFNFAKQIQSQFAYGNISTQQFIDLAESYSGFTGAELALLDQYFQQWLYGTEKPTVSPADF